MKSIDTIKLNLFSPFVAKINQLAEKYGEEFVQINGLSQNNLNFTTYIDEFLKNDTVADSSADPNANSNVHDVCTMLSDMTKPHTKLLGLNKIYYEMTKQYGIRTADEWLEKEFSGGFYLHDAASATFKSYCFAYDLTELSEQGLFFIKDYCGGKAKHLETWINHVIEFVSWASNRTSGAVGLPDVLVKTFYFWKKDMDNDYLGIKSSGNEMKYLENALEHFIYSINKHFVRNSSECSFTNVSIFDRPYLVEIFGGRQFPDGSFIIDYIDDILEFQKFFMEQIVRIRKKLFFTFPVLTFALLYKDGKFVDEEFARWACKHNMKWYDSNFFISKNVNALSNCCLNPDSVITLVQKDKSNKVITIGEFVNSYAYLETEQDGEDTEFIKAFNTGYTIKSFNPETQRFEFNEVIGVFKTKNLYRNNIKITLPKSSNSIIMTPDHNMVVLDSSDNTFKSIKAAELLTDRAKEHYKLIIESSNKRTPEYTEYEVESIDPESDWVYCLEVKDTHNFISNNINVGNCRLISNVDNLTGFQNSIGGSALKIGSVKVNTINLNRIALLTNSKEEYLKELRKRVDLCIKVLDVQRHIIKRDIEKGLLPNFTHNLIELEHCYSTIGINGLYEAVETMGGITVDEFGNHFYTDEGLQFGKDILNTINEVKNTSTIPKGYKLNVEAIPAETAAVKFARRDHLLYRDKVYSDLYSNQWIGLPIQTTLDERIRLSGIYDEMCGGGQICHINIQNDFASFNQAWENLNYIASKGVIYFAYNKKISICDQGHCFFGEVCPTCGGRKVDEISRVVGFLVKRASFSSARKKEFDKRKWYLLESNKADI